MDRMIEVVMRQVRVMAVAWLRHQNRDGRNVYIGPKREQNLSLADGTRNSVELTLLAIQKGLVKS
jgi:hypothetical protein